MGKITLVLGGIKSGKTRYAEQSALKKESMGSKILYLATAEALDDEMKNRIKRHKQDRPKTWDTIEETINIQNVIEKYGDTYNVVLLDCLTLWLTNRVLKEGEDYARETLLTNIVNEFIEVIHVVKTKKCDFIIISNQVEVGLVSPYPLGRLFQDLAGLLHQKIAIEADTVVVLQAGLPLYLKGEN